MGADLVIMLVIFGRLAAARYSGWSMVSGPLSFPKAGRGLTLERVIRNG
jgi:hypothetical protein